MDTLLTLVIAAGGIATGIGDPAMYEEFERINRVDVELDREQGTEPHPQDWLRRLMEDEAVVGAEDAS